ncbi:MAG: hypothetical protein EB167_09730, partial [Nitrososphaeria archaeon]|nr:hypothetical protein [Nitrososphaeria archaeon]
MKLFLFVILILASTMILGEVFADDKPSSKSDKKSGTSSQLPNKEFAIRIVDQFKTDKEWKKINSTSVFETWIK